MLAELAVVPTRVVRSVSLYQPNSTVVPVAQSPVRFVEKVPSRLVLLAKANLSC